MVFLELRRDSRVPTGNSGCLLSADLHTRRILMPDETRLGKLKWLVVRLEQDMELCEIKELAPLARQYREALKEIEEIEGAQQNDDDISEILSERAATGKSGTVR